MELQSFSQKISAIYPGRIYHDVSLAGYTTWKIGGPAQFFFQPRDSQECAAALSLAEHYEIPVTYLGGGSNILVADQGVQGLVIQTRALLEIEWQENRLRAGAGCSLPQLARESCRQGLTGLEFAVGIPGTLGGAVQMNAGAHGGSMAELVETVRVVTPKGEIRDILREDLTFGYRSSCLQKSGFLLTEITLVLQPGDQATIEKQLTAILAIRQAKQPLQYPNAGSVFRNPPGDAAGRIIEAVGAKGRRVGNAQIAEKHANFILNLGGATASEVNTLIKEVQELVYREFGFLLETEVVRLGFDDNGR